MQEFHNTAHKKLIPEVGDSLLSLRARCLDFMSDQCSLQYPQLFLWVPVPKCADTVVIDKFSVLDDGAAAIYLGQKPRIRNVMDEQGMRPWVSKYQYILNQ